jgi:hypothetical protein
MCVSTVRYLLILIILRQSTIMYLAKYFLPRKLVIASVSISKRYLIQLSINALYVKRLLCNQWAVEGKSITNWHARMDFVSIAWKITSLRFFYNQILSSSVHSLLVEALWWKVRLLMLLKINIKKVYLIKKDVYMELNMLVCFVLLNLFQEKYHVQGYC